MKINCDWEKCVSDCKYFDVCNLHEPFNTELFRVNVQLNWLVQRLSEINNGIGHFNTILFQLKHGQLSQFVMEHMSEYSINKKLAELKIEKEQTMVEIRKYQVKEKNMRKILKKRKSENYGMEF